MQVSVKTSCAFVLFFYHEKNVQNISKEVLEANVFLMVSMTDGDGLMVGTRTQISMVDQLHVTLHWESASQVRTTYYILNPNVDHFHNKGSYVKRHITHESYIILMIFLT